MKSAFALAVCCLAASIIISAAASAQSGSAEFRPGASPEGLELFDGLPPGSESTDGGSPAGLSDLGDPCWPGKWSLKGADYRVDQTAGAVYNPIWEAVLNTVAACMGRSGKEASCLNIQGQFDAIPFSKGIIAAFGSIEAAQAARGRGRASMVTSKLFELGISTRRLREIPPPRSATFRGVELAIVDDCIEIADPHPKGARGAEPAQVFVPDGEPMPRGRSDGYSRPGPGAYPPPTVIVEQAPVEPEKPIDGDLYLQAGLDFTLVAPDPSVVPGGMISLGIGGRYARVYAILNAGALLNGPAASRSGFDGRISVGMQIFDWLQAGVYGGYRILSPSPTEPWLDEVGYGGLEATECLREIWSGASLCFRQGIAPLGVRHRRGEMQGDIIVRTTSEHHYQMDLDLAVLLRQELDILLDGSE